MAPEGNKAPKVELTADQRALLKAAQAEVDKEAQVNEADEAQRRYPKIPPGAALQLFRAQKVIAGENGGDGVQDETRQFQALAIETLEIPDATLAGKKIIDLAAAIRGLQETKHIKLEQDKFQARESLGETDTRLRKQIKEHLIGAFKALVGKKWNMIADDYRANIRRTGDSNLLADESRWLRDFVGRQIHILPIQGTGSGPDNLRTAFENSYAPAAPEIGKLFDEARKRADIGPKS